MTKRVVCPACGQSDRVEKVSTLYITGIGMKRRPKEWKIMPSEGGPSGEEPLVTVPDALVSKLAPPASGKSAPTRPLHPDLIVITFSLIAPVFLYGVLTTQARLFLPMVAILLALYAFYFWKRKAVIAKFERQQKERQAKEARIQRGISRWMKLYYCGRDDGVFEPGKGELMPVDFMPGYILGNDSSK